MTKKIDTNGYWYIKKNPISKEGVFPYLGHNISDECEPNKIYKVYRPASTLKDSVETWDNPPKPFIDDHEMLGEGFTAIDDRPVQGIIYNPVFDNGVLYADIAVYSEDLKSNIENGKKELSLGYFCKYKKERGVFNGEVYDYVQYDMVGNHIALVDAGRCGSDVKVFDHKCTMDSLALSGFEESPLKKANENGIIESKETKGTEMYVTIDEVRRLLTESFTYGDEVDPKVKLIVEALESKAKSTLDEDEKEEEKKSEDSDEEKEEKETEDKCGKDEDDDEKKESEDKDDEKKETEDSIKELMSVVKDMALDIKKLVAKDEDDEEKKESEDGDDSEKESEDEDDEEKKSEDEDEEETKKSEDSAVFVFGQDSAIAEDEGLKEYLK